MHKKERKTTAFWDIKGFRKSLLLLNLCQLGRIQYYKGSDCFLTHIILTSPCQGYEFSSAWENSVPGKIKEFGLVWFWCMLVTIKKKKIPYRILQINKWRLNFKWRTVPLSTGNNSQILKRCISLSFLQLPMKHFFSPTGCFHFKVQGCDTPRMLYIFFRL